MLFGPLGKPGFAGSSPGSPLGDAPVPIVPGDEVFGTPATGGAVVAGGGDDALDPVVPVDGLVVVGGADVPGAGVPIEGFGTVPVMAPGSGVAPTFDRAGPVPVCALAYPLNASSTTIAR